MAEANDAPKVDPEAATLFDPTTSESGEQREIRAREASERYEVRGLLGRGGMGAVNLCRDAFIGREVAMKVMIVQGPRESETPMATAHRRARFVREASVQGQLEHPAIVPVYDIGVAPDGEVYFTMKCLRGKTLSDLLSALRRGDEEMRARFNRHRLLQIFVQVCQAVDFAHARGVVHRDLKPSNVMLGDFGEVYVLDWGIAKVVGSSEPECEGEPSGPALSLPDGDQEVSTTVGAIVGTVGYLSPEQGRGRPIDARSDVYSLGAILFELCTLQPLHDLAHPQAALAATLLGDVERSPSARGATEVAPELDAICVQATATKAEERFASVRELCDTVQRYLDGDRDLTRRRALASEHAAKAKAAALRAVRGEEEGRRTALREIGCALALDPTSPEAMRALVSVLSTPPERFPADVEREIEAREAARRRHTARVIATGTTVGTFALVGALFSTGLRRWEPAALLAFFMLASAGVAVVGSQKAAYRLYFLVDISLRMSAMAVLGFVFGPFLVLPSIFTLGGSVLGVIDDRVQRSVGLGIIVSTALALIGLERAGALAAHYRFEPGSMTLTSSMLSLPETPTLACLAVVMLFLTVLPFVAFGRLRGRIADSERTNALREWHFSSSCPSRSAESLAMVLRTRGLSL